MITRRFVREFWGPTAQAVMAKCMLMERYCQEMEIGTIEIMPLWFRLDTENFHRRVRIITDKNPRVLTANADLIDREVNAQIERFR